MIQAYEKQPRLCVYVIRNDRRRYLNLDFFYTNRGEQSNLPGEKLGEYTEHLNRFLLF
jgi:hypothetical protein